MKHLFQIIFLCGLLIPVAMKAQEKKPADWRQLHYLSEEEMSLPVTNHLTFTETDPPEGDVRMVAEYEPMQSVLIRYPLGIPYSAIAEMAEDINVVTLVNSSSQANQVLALYEQNNVNTENCSFIITQTDSYWTRDYGPWFVFDGNKEPGIVDFPYDRPRPNDNNVPAAVAADLGINLFGMNLVHTGGNMMVDGTAMAASTDLVYDENSLTPQQVAQKVEDYLGIVRYDVTIDPLGDYIKHIDCWGKYLGPDKILIGQVPESDPRYSDYESVANYFATTPCVYGYPYEVYRVYTPGGSQTTAYTNSLILNNKVLLPLSGSQWDDEAIAVYEEAMPGYEIVPVVWNSWYNTDAIHCRTRGIADLEMLYVDHRPLFDEVEYAENYTLSSEIIAYSGDALVSDSLLVFYSINGGDYNPANFTADGSEEDMFHATISGFEAGDTIRYYVFAKDETGRRLKQPIMGELDPHEFIVGEQSFTDLTFMPDTLVYNYDYEQFITLTNPTSDAVIISDLEHDGLFEFYDIPDLPFEIPAGESLEIMVYLNPGVMLDPIVYYETQIDIVTNLNTYLIPVKINIDLISGFDQIKLFKFSVYPNPFNDKLFVQTENAIDESVDLTIRDLTGRLIAEQQIENSGHNSFEIKLPEHLDKGLYFITISNANQQQIVKVIKQ
jgi:agmatine/peptidylarginine deiminase